MLKIVERDDEVARRADELEAECAAESARLRQAEEAGEIVSWEEMAAMAERDIYRCRYLSDHGIIPAEMLEDAIRRHRRILCLMAGGRKQ
jgi:hypothetical protein